MAYREFRDMSSLRNRNAYPGAKIKLLVVNNVKEFERSQRNYPAEEWGKLYQAGATYRQIAELYGVSYAVVRRIPS